MLRPIGVQVIRARYLDTLLSDRVERSNDELRAIIRDELRTIIPDELRATIREEIGTAVADVFTPAVRREIDASAANAIRATVNRTIDLGQPLVVALKDVRVAAQLRAADQSATWLHDHADKVPSFENRVELIDDAVERLSISGDILEFGVFTGAVTRYLHALLPDRAYHAFDSFKGVPEGMSLSVEQNAFDLGGVVPTLPQGVIVHAGWFSDTIPSYRSAFTDPVALAYIDCDLYESVRSVLLGIGDRLRNGSILIFDDWYNFPNWQDHSHRALNEFASQHNMTFQPIGCSVTEHAVSFQCVCNNE